MAANKQTANKAASHVGKTLAKPSTDKAAKSAAARAVTQKNAPKVTASAKAAKSAAAPALSQSVARKSAGNPTPSAPAKPAQYSSVWDVLADPVETGVSDVAAQAAGADFWQSPSLAELAKQQGVRPVEDASALLGGWPGDVNDGFEEAITKARRTGMTGGGK